MDKASIEEINLSDESMNLDMKPKRKRGRPRKVDGKSNIAEKPKRKYNKRKNTGDDGDESDDGEAVAKAILDSHSRSLCDEIYDLRVNQKSTYISIAKRYGLEKKEAKQICVYYEDIKKLGK